MTTLAHTIESAISVSQLNQQSACLLQNHFKKIWVRGEISNLARPQSGHLYFSLKDENAQIRCAFFKGKQRPEHQALEHGQAVLVLAQVSLYQPRGDYQLIVEQVEPAGIGALQKAFEQLKKQLAPLFDDKHKQPIPTMPTRLGLVTSSTGAALRDMLKVTRRRYPAMPIVIYPCQVQGSKAASTIVNAIQIANLRKEVDCLIVARGGGSLEDLWPFNESVVAQAIFDSHIPIVSGVGHETDTTIADLVADHRAATPSAAAEYCTPEVKAIGQHARQLFSHIKKMLMHQLAQQQLLLSQLGKQLKHPSEKMQQQHQSLDWLQEKMHRAMQQHITEKRTLTHACHQRLWLHNPSQAIRLRTSGLMHQQSRLAQSMRNTILRLQNQCQQAATSLHQISPLQTLKRGYAIITDPADTILHSAKQVQIGDTVHCRLQQGTLTCTVDKSEDSDLL